MSAKVTKYVAEQLRNLLGTYVDGVSEETLNLQLLGGKMQLENLSIRETAFAELEMPFKASGRVGKMGLSINLLKFWWNEPVIISLHDVEIVLEPLEQGKEMDPADFAAHFERIRKWKEAQVHAIQEAAEGGGGRAAGGFLARLGKKIRENLQIHINDFRIEYIDRRTPESAFTAGLYLGSLVAMSSEDKEHAGAAEGEAHGGGGITEKALEVRDFYFFVRPLEDDALRNRSAEVSAATRKVDAEYQIIRPVHLTLHFTINDEHQLQVPQYHLDVRVDKLEWIFIRRQYLLVHKLMEEITAYRSRLEHWFWRPRAPPLQAPRAWFKYAGRCVREQVHHRRFAQQHGERYGRMYTAHLLGQDSAEDKEELARLERHMAADALAALRSAAKQAASAREAAMAEAKKEAKSKQTATWGGWAKSFVASSVPADFDTAELDEESREMLTEALQQTVQGEGSDGMEVNAFPREYARFSMDLAVEMGSLTLVQSGWAGEELVELAYAQFDALEVEYQIRRDTYRYAFTLESLRMDDRLNSVQGLNQIASCRQFEEGDREKILRWDWDSLPTTDSDKDGGTLNIVVDGLSLVYSVDCVLGVYNFWMVPKEQRFPAMPEGAQAAEEEGAESSESQLQLWRDRTRFDKRMKWELVMKRPCMLFPADHHSSTEPVVVLELDHITWSSAISDAHEAGFSPLALPDFFDRNVLSAEQTRFLLVKDVGQWLECGSIGAGSNVKDQVTIANNFNFKMVWDTCKLTEELRKGQALAKYDLAFRLPEVELSCTAEQYSAFWYTFFAVVRSHYPPQPPSTAAEEVAVSQEPLPDRSFVFSFDADDMRLRMKSADESSAAVALLSLKGFNVVYENGSRSTLAFGMNRLDLEGIAGGSVLFATSAVSEGTSEESFVCIKRGWNHAALPDHPGYDQWWDLRFRGLVLNWNDKTVAALMEYTSAAFKERAKPQIANEQQGEAAVDADHRIEDGAVNDSVVSATRQAEDQSVAVTPSRLKTQVTASIELLRTTLMRDGDGVAKLEMSALTCKYELGAHGSKTTGKLGNFVVEDLSRPDTLFQEKLGLRDTSRSVVEFELSTYSASGAEHPGYDSMLVLEMSSTRLVYMKRFVDELRAYIAAEPLISGIMGKTASAVAESAKKAAGHHRRGQGLAKVRCKLVNPLVVLPVEDSSEEHLVADLGEILLENRFSTEGEKRIEHFEVGVKAMNLQEGGKSHLMEDLDMSLKGQREIGTVNYSFVDAEMFVSSVGLCLSSSHVGIMSKLWHARGKPAADAAAAVEDAASDGTGSHVVDGKDTDQKEVTVDSPAVVQRRWRIGVNCTGMEATFRVNKPEGPQDIAHLNLSGVAANYVIGPEGTEVDLKVLVLVVNDLWGNPAGPRQLVSSTSGASSEHLVAVKYRTRAIENKDADAVDAMWDFDFRCLELNWNDKTVALLMEFVTEIQAGARLESQEAAGTKDAPSMEAVAIDSLEVAETKRKRKLEINASIQLLSATLMRDSQPVARVAMSAATCKYELGAHGSKTTGKLGNFVVEDLSRPDTLFQEKLGLRDTSRSVVEFELSTYSASGAEHPGYDSMLVLEMSSTRLVYMKRFVDELRAYIAAEPLISGIMGKTASAVAESAKKAAGHHRRGQGLAKVRCKLVNPLVVLPVEDSSEEHLVADLGEILLENRFSTEGEKRIEHFEVGVKAMNLQEGGKSYLMEAVDLQLTGNRLLVSDGASRKPLDVELQISDLNILLFDRQVYLLRQIAATVLGGSDRAADSQGAQVEAQGSSLKGDAEAASFMMNSRVLFQGATLMLHTSESPYPIATCSVRDVNTQFSVTGKGTDVVLQIASLEMMDGKGRTFASSMGNTSSADAEQQLVVLKHRTVAPDSKDHPGYDSSWDLDFRSLVLNWNDKTIALLVEFGEEALRNKEGGEAAPNTSQHVVNSEGKPVSSSREGDKAGAEVANKSAENAVALKAKLKMQVTASIQLLSAVLMRDGDGVAKLEMSALTCKYELGAHGSKTTGKLGNFVVEDLSRPDTLFQEKLGLRDTSRSVVEFELSTYSASGAEHPGYDSMLVLEMSSTRLVYMKRFVDELRAYIAAEPLISGIMGKTASAVAESAKKAAGHHRRGQGLAKVRCKLVNPLVVLPVEDSSEEHLVADLGEILLENRFSTEGEKRIEHFEVGVKAMNLQEGGKSHLMENVDVKLLCSRELSQDGSSGFAEIDLTVSDVCAHFSESQVLLVASVQRRNLGFLSQSADDQTIEPQGRKLASTPAMDLAEDGMEPESSAGGVLFAKMGISSLQLTCYSQKLGALNAGEREPHTRVQCVNPSVSYALFDTGEVTVGCTVSKMEVVHEEAKQAGLLGHVLRYYEEERGGRQGGQAGEEKPQLQVNYGKQGKGAEGVLTISLFRPEILLLPDSLVAISNYVMALTSRLSASSAQREPSSGSIPNTPTRASLERQSLEFKSPLRIGRGAETATKVSMEILQPRISFVEQGATEQSAKGVLQSTIRLEGVLGGAGARLQSCSFEQAEMFVQAPTGTSREATPREESLRSVVDPFDMSLEATEVPHLEGAIDPGMGYTLRVKAVEAQVSYQDWLLAVKLNESWQEALRRMSNLGARSSSGLVGAGSEPAGEQASGDRGRRLMFGCEQIGITVINDCFSSSHVPVLEVRVSDLDGFMGPSKGTHVLQANLGLEADYFNMQIAAWEPVLERWPLSVSRQSPSPGHVDWRLTAVRSGEVNLTQAFVECVSLNSRTIQRALSEVGDDDDALHSNVTTLHPYHVHNNLGVPVACRTEAEGSDPDMVQELAPGDCVPMDIKSSRKKQRKRLAQAQRMWLTVGGGDVWEPSEVRIDRVGKQNLVLKSVDPKGTACKVVCNIVLEEGSKHIKLSSSVKVLNKTMHPLSLLFEPDGSQPQEGGMFDLEAEGSLIVPVQLVAHCHLRVQPTERHNWSKPLDLRAPPVDAEGKPESRVWLYNAGGNVRGGAKTDGDASFFVWVRATSPDGFLIRIILTPIITVVNQLAVPMHYQLALEPRKTAELGPIPPGGKVEHHQISPEQSAFLTIKLPGFACSSPARIQVDRRVNHDAELHREVSCKEEGEALSLAVAVNNFVVRDKPSDTGRDRNVTLSCPFWIKNLTGIPLSFCVGNPSLAPTSEYDPHEQAGAGAAKSGRNLMLPVSIAGAPEWMSKSAGALVSHAGALGVERGESKMAGQRDFNAREQALNTCSNGLVDQPFRTGAACMEPPVEYPALMLSFPRGSTRHDLYVKVAGSQWSDAIQVGKSGASGMVEILNEPTHQESRSGRPINNGFLFQLSLTTQTISQRQFKTEVLVFRPKYVIVNNLQKTLHYKQVSTDAVNTVRSQHKSNFHWPCASAPHELSIRIAPPEQQTAGSEPLWHWSGSFSISALGETHIRLRSKDGIESAQIVRVEVKNLKETLHVILHPENEIPPYRINNASSLSLMTFQSVQQRDDDAFDLIEQRASMPFAWDHPLKDKRLSVSAFGVEDAQDAKPLKLNIDAIGAHPPLVAGGLSYPIVVRADGPTKVLTISDPVAEGEDEDEDEQGAAGGSMRVGAARVLSVSLSLSRVGFNLVDITPQELVSCYLEEVQLTLISRGRDRVRVLDLSVGSCQVDNMLARTPVPVIVHSSSQQSGREHAPFFKMLVEQDAKDSAGGVTILKRVQAELKDIQLSLEGRIVVLTFVYYLACRHLFKLGKGVRDSGAVLQEDEMELFKATTRKWIYFEQFALPAVNVVFTFVRRDLTEGDALPSLEVLNKVSWLAASVDDASLSLNELEATHVFMDLGMLMGFLQEHYQKECMRQFYRLLGSVEVLGNPAGLLRNLNTGMRAFTAGLRHGDRQSLKDGAKTFVKHGTHGVSNTISKVSSSFSRGLASVSLDEDFLREREENKDHKGRPQSMQVGFSKGASNFGKSAFSGFTGFFKKPLEGYQQGGMGGFVEGVGVGVAGLVCKPTSGLLDLVANTTEGLRNQTNPHGKAATHSRCREPREMQKDDPVLKPLDSGVTPEGELMARLKTYSSCLPGLRRGELWNDTFIKHMSLPHGLLVFTNFHCIFTKYLAPAAHADDALGIGAALNMEQVKGVVLVWHLQWKELVAVEVKDDALVLQADPAAKASWEQQRISECGCLAEDACRAVHDAWNLAMEEDEAELVA